MLLFIICAADYNAKLCFIRALWNRWARTLSYIIVGFFYVMCLCLYERLCYVYCSGLNYVTWKCFSVAG